MGYSCAALANLTLDAIMSNVSHVNGSSNVWSHKNVVYMYEVGRENYDGSMTGSIHRFTDANCTMAVRAGTFRIEADGLIVRFPGTSHNNKNSAMVSAAQEYIRRYGFPRKDTICTDHPAYGLLCKSPFVVV